MSGNFLALAQPGVQQLSPYVPGKPVDELARELDLDPAKIVKLASNENPLGASPKALAAIREELAELTRYPDGNGFELNGMQVATGFDGYDLYFFAAGMTLTLGFHQKYHLDATTEQQVDQFIQLLKRIAAVE